MYNYKYNESTIVQNPRCNAHDGCTCASLYVSAHAYERAILEKAQVLMSNERLLHKTETLQVYETLLGNIRRL